MKFYDNMPIYIQIAGDIKEKIISGLLNENDKLSSIREYSSIYEVTTLTMQRAMQQLETDGIIWTKKGVGCFIADGIRQTLQKDMVDAQVKEFIFRMKNMGLADEKIILLIKEALKNE